MFDGRVAEDFKLTTGTWVSVGAIRVGVIAALDPFVQDAVITGHDRNDVGVLLFLNPSTTRDVPADRLRQRIADALTALGKEGGSSTRPVRALLMSEPPSIDGNEITDKGYINQRAVLERRAALVDRLYSDDPGRHRPVDVKPSASRSHLLAFAALRWTCARRGRQVRSR
jgi:feruloyl-CoA synthase